MNAQLSLALDDAKPRYRRTDPATSRLAAVKAGEFIGSHEQRIVQALQTHGPRSARELEQLIGLSVVQIDRRIALMRRKRLVEAQTNSDCTATVRGGCTVWVAVGQV